jgi:hypothetical protein
MRLRGPGGPWGRAIQCLLPMSPRSRWKTPGIGARLPTYRLTTRNSALIAAWFVVIE